MRLFLQSLRKKTRYGAIEEEQNSLNLVVAIGKVEIIFKGRGQKKKTGALKAEDLS